MRTMKTPFAPPFSRHWSCVVLNVIRVGPVPRPADFQTNPAGTLETFVPRTVNPAGTSIAMHPIGWGALVTATVTSVGTFAVRTWGLRAIDQGATALTVAGFPGVAAAANPTIASVSATVARLVRIRRPGDPAA
jgi:hypothetical protein